MCLFIQVVNNLIKDFIKGLRKVEKLPRRDEGRKRVHQVGDRDRDTTDPRTKEENGAADGGDFGTIISASSAEEEENEEEGTTASRVEVIMRKIMNQ